MAFYAPSRRMQLRQTCTRFSTDEQTTRRMLETRGMSRENTDIRPILVMHTWHDGYAKQRTRKCSQFSRCESSEMHSSLCMSAMATDTLLRPV
jgi:hypothetical protein